MSARKDLTGRKFNRLAVVSYVGKSKWLCRCDCGQSVHVRGTDLKKSCGTKSCGCLRAKAIGIRQRTHGLRSHRLHGVWSKMKSRCLNSNAHNFDYYGGRGISVCDRWLDFKNFVDDMGATYPGEGYTLNRIDNDGPYSPLNCRWATKKEQMRNTRSNRIIEHDGMKMSAADWADKLGIDGNSFRSAVHTKGEISAIEWAKVKSNSAA